MRQWNALDHNELIAIENFCVAYTYTEFSCNYKCTFNDARKNAAKIKYCSSRLRDAEN